MDISKNSAIAVLCVAVMVVAASAAAIVLSSNNGGGEGTSDWAAYSYSGTAAADTWIMGDIFLDPSSAPDTCIEEQGQIRYTGLSGSGPYVTLHDIQTLGSVHFGEEVLLSDITTLAGYSLAGECAGGYIWEKTAVRDDGTRISYWFRSSSGTTPAYGNIDLLQFSTLRTGEEAGHGYLHKHLYTADVVSGNVSGMVHTEEAEHAYETAERPYISGAAGGDIFTYDSWTYAVRADSREIPGGTVVRNTDTGIVMSKTTLSEGMTATYALTATGYALPNAFSAGDYLVYAHEHIEGDLRTEVYEKYVIESISGADMTLGMWTRAGPGEEWSYVSSSSGKQGVFGPAGEVSSLTSLGVAHSVGRYITTGGGISMDITVYKASSDGLNMEWDVGSGVLAEADSVGTASDSYYLIESNLDLVS